MISLGGELTAQLESVGSELEIDPDLLLDHTLVLGAAGSGKTTFGLQLIDRVLDLGHPVLVLDTTGDISTTLMETRGVPLIRGFADDPEPTDPRIQLNAIDLSAASGMFHRPTIGSVVDEYWIEEIEALVRALLDLLGYRVRGKTPEALLLEHLVLHAWQVGSDLDLDRLAAMVSSPPFSSIGVFAVDSVVGPDRRADLASAILSVLDAPAFVSDANPLSIDLPSLLAQPDGSAAANVISFAQRSIDVRRFLAAVVLAKLATFVRYRSSEEVFSLLVYIDEGPSFIPSGQRVSTTGPLKAMLDGWRKFGVAVALVAEQPEDLDEDALDLSETWVVGRLPVARSRAAVVAELDLVNPPINEVELDTVLKRLSAGQFVLRSPRIDTLRYFQSPR